MATSGNTTTDALADSLPVVVASARIVREFEGVMPQLCDKVTLGEGDGLDWKEISLAHLTAMAVTENSVNSNPQQMADTAFTVTPTVTQIHTVVTDRVAARISKNAYGKMGALVQNAIQRKKDQDGLVALQAGSTGASPGAGNTLTSGHIASAAVRATSNTTEPSSGKLRGVLHGFQIKDIYDEVTATLGTGEVSQGETATVFREGFKGTIHGVQIFEDGNITIDSSDDGIGGVFPMEALVLVQGRGLKTETRREPQIGGGATSLWLTDEFAYGERSAGNWLYQVKSDCTAPSS